ncbi:GntR family transcriptional regulator [Roseomonas sp. E05]|uniref:GntR family transcriptional regulator n=1 Tax=Roseomonas sp. E05 TaxID=3046310 RepID=UPI0024BB722A|nr:GntR family transcriptional regulator [Roseomonas sp. E05]MDJ0387004.1 GntR family transcriptional regulator [Roseomonas sp. E05]
MSRPPAVTLHRKLARAILAHLRTSAAEPGLRLTETMLAGAVGTSRAPVRGAIALLAELGVLEREARRLVLRRLPEAGEAAIPLDAEEAEAERLYWRLARERLAGALPELVGAADLARRYGAPRAVIERVLQQAAGEGWIERSPAGGWRFLPLIEGQAGQDEAYRFRRAIEPAALLDPGFALPAAVAARLRREQAALAARDPRSLGPREAFEANSGFHLALMQASNNRFFADAAQRLTRLRRLIGYVIAADQERLVSQFREHLAILDRVEAREMEAAAALMRRHLDAGRAAKDRLLAQGLPEPRGGA